MSSNKSITTSGSTSTEVKSSTTQQQRSSTTQHSAQRSHVSKTTGSETIEKSSQSFGGNATTTDTTTIYDADGNVVKVIKNVNNQAIPGGHNRSIEYTNTSDERTSANNQRHAADNQNHRTIEIQQEYDDRARSPTQSDAGSVATTYLVDENYVDMNKMRNKTTGSNFKNFYGHGVDSSRTVVGNAYDSNAVQNTIGTRGRVVMDHNIDTTDVVFSNDRNYGKTGWNGQFTDEVPQVRRVVEVTKQKPWEKPASIRVKGRLRPEDLPPAGVPTASRR